MANLKKVTNEVYAGHRAGSRKGHVHLIFDKKGKEAALDYGLELGLKQSTLVQWCRSWAREQA